MIPSSVVEKEESIKQSPIIEPVNKKPTVRENDEERIALEIAIQRSLEDQKQLPNQDIEDQPHVIDSSSDSDGKL